MKHNFRKYVLGSLVLLVAFIYIGKLFYIQVIDTKYKVSAENNSQRHIIKYPSRGLIYDRNHHLMVYNQAAYDLMITPRDVKPFDTTDFCSILNLEKEELKAEIHKAKKYSWYKPSILIKQLSAKEYAVLQEKLFKFPGFFVQTRSLRFYPDHSAAHLLGYVGEVNQSVANKDSYYNPGDYIGISGIEKSYEKELRGEKGVNIYLVDVHNRIKGSLQGGKYDKTAKKGKDLVLGIDQKLQAYGEKLMQNKIGSIVAIEPESGEILALISSPGYDPNLLVGRVRGENYKTLSIDTLKPLFNRALMAQYPPGSTFKPATGLIGLQEGVLHSGTKYSCAGTSAIPIHCSHNHESPLDLEHAIEQSCNSYFWQVFRSVFHQNKYQTTQEAYQVWKNYVNSFGFGRTFNTDLFSELRGNIPESSYYDYYYGKNGWKAITIRSLAIGQGEILVTPMQLANYTALIANRGYYIKPHLVKEIENERIDSSFTQKHFPDVDKRNFDIIARGMHEVYAGEHGTARWYNIDTLQMCGKTGTAENPHGDDHSIFIAFAPFDHPKIAISVIVENSGFGSTWAVPIATLMMEYYLTGEISRKYIEDRMINGNLIQP